jgi:hypothetical protein
VPAFSFKNRRSAEIPARRDQGSEQLAVIEQAFGERKSPGIKGVRWHNGTWRFQSAYGRR